MTTPGKPRCAVVVPPVQPYGSQISEYLGAGLIRCILEQEGYPVVMHNFFGTNLTLEECTKLLLAGGYDWIGLTAPFVSEAAAGIDLSCALRAAGYNGTITMGGVAATLNAEKILNAYPVIDSIAIGEASQSIRRFLSCLGQKDKLFSLPGFYFADKGTVLKNPCSTEPVDLNTEPLILPANPGKVMFYSSSRGCPFRCTYCCNAAYRKLAGQRAWTAKQPEHVVEELERYYREYGKDIFLFVDDNFFGSSEKSGERALRIAELILEKNLKIQLSIECRVTDVKKRLMRVLKAAGLSWVRLGIESGVQRMLNSWQKRTTVEQNQAALEILSDLGITVHINYMFLDPWSTYAEIKENFEFIRKHKLHLLSDDPLLFFCNNVAILAGTEMEKVVDEIPVHYDWNIPSINEKQNNIVKELKMLYQYKFKEELVNKYFQTHIKWINSLQKRTDYFECIMNAAADRIPPDYQKKINKWLFNYRYQVIDIVETEIYHLEELAEEEFRQQALARVEQYDRQVLNMSFEEFKALLPSIHEEKAPEKN